MQRIYYGTVLTNEPYEAVTPIPFCCDECRLLFAMNVQENFDALFEREVLFNEPAECAWCLGALT